MIYGLERNSIFRLLSCGWCLNVRKTDFMKFHEKRSNDLRSKNGKSSKQGKEKKKMTADDQVQQVQHTQSPQQQKENKSKKTDSKSAESTPHQKEKGNKAPQRSTTIQHSDSLPPPMQLTPLNQTNLDNFVQPQQKQKQQTTTTTTENAPSQGSGESSNPVVVSSDVSSPSQTIPNTTIGLSPSFFPPGVTPPASDPRNKGQSNAKGINMMHSDSDLDSLVTNNAGSTPPRVTAGDKGKRKGVIAKK